MYSLFIDTHDCEIILILYKDDLILLKESIISINDHSTKTLLAIQELLSKALLQVKDINQIIIVNGPGSWTGIRIGMTIAKILANCLKIPIKTIDYLLMQAISFESSKEKLVFLSDKYGKYIGLFNSKNELMKDYAYLKNVDFDNLDKSNLELIENYPINYYKIFKYLQEKNAENVHSVKPLYIKSIGV